MVNPRFLRTITQELLPILLRWASVPEFVRVLRLDLASEQGATGGKSHSTLLIFCAEFSSSS